jgi:hypothetical protein
MGWIANHRIEQTRTSERARFERWFVPTALGLAYIDRQGRPRSVSQAEHQLWQDRAFAIVDKMVVKLEPQAMTLAFAMVATIAAASFAATWLGFTGAARATLVSVAVVIVEGGLLGIEIYDYWHDWHRLRSDIEAAVTGRAPLAVDPDRARIPHNWFQTAQYVIAAGIIAFYFAGHLYVDLIERFDFRYALLLVPLAWGLHFAGRRHDRAAQDRLRR